MIHQDLIFAAPHKLARDYRVPYNPDKPRMKDIIWHNYDWLKKLDEDKKARSTILNNIQRTLLCNTCYLRYDFLE